MAPNRQPRFPGWDIPAWAVRGVKDGPELIWQREASVDVTYADGGVEDTFAPQLVRTDQVVIGEAGAAVHVGETVVHFADDAYITPTEAEARRGAGRVGRIRRRAAMTGCRKQKSSTRWRLGAELVERGTVWLRVASPGGFGS
jgi:hypothetical protein